MRHAIPILSSLVLATATLPGVPVLAAAPAGASSAGHAALETASVEQRLLPREYRLDGIVEAVDRTTISAQTRGQVREILFDVDDFVAKDAIIVRLKDTEHRARVSEAEADLQSAEARQRQAMDDARRVNNLYRRKNVSDAEKDKAEADLATARARLDVARARLEQAREQLAYTEVRAPYAGLVTARHVALGEIASPGTPLMSGMSLERLRVTVDVPQGVGMALRGTADGGVMARVYPAGGAPIESREVTLFPYADPGSNTFKARIVLPALPPDENRLFPGMYVKCGFLIGEDRQVTIPRAALVRRSELTAVYVLDSAGRVHLRQVRLGRELADGYVVLAGLDAGERVALDPISAGALLKRQVRSATKGGAHD